ncbi:MAG: succinyldiaminopimelate transaminase [Gammaproteobacteria bacterium]|nr:succinyldiaminopimelate transaminase [Gammaproteobacteria bacterium]
MNPDLNQLQPYPFEKIRKLLAGLDTNDKKRIALSVGEPKHAAPTLALAALVADLSGLEIYPGSKGTDSLRRAIALWLQQRYQLSNDTDALASHHIQPVNGTREALFAIAQCLLDRTSNRAGVLMPNPFYQIYEGAALLAGCKPCFYAIGDDADADIAAIKEPDWQHCQMIYICNPGNPTGAVMSLETLKKLIELAHKHDFIIVSDECYSEIYRETAGPPTGLLEASMSYGDETFARCLAFHSLSKRSNLPGLRSGFVAGDAALIKRFLEYRTYHGCTMAPPIQNASIAAWNDEAHVVENRQAYDSKYAAVVPILNKVIDVSIPPAGFYLWPRVPTDDKQLTQRLHAEQNLAVVPGSYLARETQGENPGLNRLRLALVAPIEDCIDAANRIVDTLN